MNRWRMLMLCTGAALASCQTEAITTTEATQELGDCTPGANFCGAQMPPIPYWQGQPPPAAGPKQTYEMYESPAGEWVFALADTGQKKIVWAVRVKKASLGLIVPGIAEAGPIDGVRPPPPPPGGTEGMYLLERSLRFQQLDGEAKAAVAQCGP